MPADYTHSDKEHYLQIAMRAQTEGVSTYSILCLGLQSYLQARKLAAKNSSSQE